MPTYRVTGKVQHVGFRRYVADQARELGISANAENLDDGSVRVTGDARIAPWLREGPGRVESVKEEKGESKREDLSTKSVTICDNGLFVALAEHLSHSFGKTRYYSTWESQLPTSNRTLIGTGIPGVERVNNIWETLDDTDLFVFPDLFMGPLQLHLQGLGKRVWGARMAEELEIFRSKSKEHLKSVGVNIGRYKTIVGMERLRNFLKEHDDQYIKLNQNQRGDSETFHAAAYEIVEPKLDELADALGARQHITEFTVEEAIDGAHNLGWDAYTVDGQFPDKNMIGLEVKDRAYCGKVLDRRETPKQITEVNDKLAETLKNYQCRSFFTTELSVTKDGKAWAVDPTARTSSPPGELIPLIYENLPQIFWGGGNGELVQPEISSGWGVQLILYSEFGAEHWCPVKYPKKLANNVRLRNWARIQGRDYVIPQSVGMSEIGGVVAVGDTLDAAIEECTEIAEQIEGFYVKTFPECLKHAQEELENLAKFGVKL